MYYLQLVHTVTTKSIKNGNNRFVKVIINSQKSMILMILRIIIGRDYFVPIVNMVNIQL